MAVIVTSCSMECYQIVVFEISFTLLLSNSQGSTKLPKEILKHINVIVDTQRIQNHYCT